jgi:hypothetical protein
VNKSNRRTFVATAGALVLATSRAAAQGGENMAFVDFEDFATGALPPGFTPALTGSGGPVAWSILEDATSLAGPKVLAQTSSDKTDYRFPLMILEQPRAADVTVAVRFKPVAGEVDRAAGIAVRLTDADNYYVVRANALEDNVRFYRVVKGSREELEGVNIKVSGNAWHTLGFRAEGERFTVTFDGKQLFTASDPTFADAGKVALWTKADSVTRFDRIEIKPLP